MTVYVMILIWLIGAVVAWFQIKRWNNLKVMLPTDYLYLTLLSLLSWLVYPINSLDKYINRINTK